MPEETQMTMHLRVPNVTHDALGFHLGLGRAATTEELAKHSAAMLGTIHRQLVTEWRRGNRMAGRQ
jgi:hypothetical protein